MTNLERARRAQESVLSYSIDEIVELYLYSDISIREMAKKYYVYITCMEKFLRKLGLKNCRAKNIK